MSQGPRQRPTRTAGMSAKDEILARVRTALAEPRDDEVTTADDVPRTYQRADAKQETSTDPAKVRDILTSRLEDYTAVVHRSTAAELPAAIAAAVGGAGTLIVPAGLPPAWTAGLDTEVIRDDGTAGPRDLDRIEAVLTGCHTAIAQTGTIVLRGDGTSGRRAITLVPDHHVIVVEADQVVLGVPKAIERMNQDPTAAWTMVSGPSATSDIELSRVEGVHGPRRLDIVLVDPDPPSGAETAPTTAADQKDRT